MLWTAALAIDYAGPAWLTRERLRGLQEVAVAHFAERYGLFVIICLGESIVAIGLSASGEQIDHSWSPQSRSGLRSRSGCGGRTSTASPRVAEERLRGHDDPVLAAADGYSYLHL